jgi:hypothetical protein
MSRKWGLTGRLFEFPARIWIGLGWSSFVEATTTHTATMIGWRLSLDEISSRLAGGGTRGRLGDMNTVRKRLIGALCVVAILLSLVPGLDVWNDPGQWLSRYSPSVAILTLTLIAVILYAAFTFELVEETRAIVKLDRERMRRERLDHRATRLDTCSKLFFVLFEFREFLHDFRNTDSIWEGIREGPDWIEEVVGTEWLEDRTKEWSHRLVTELRQLAVRIGAPVEDPAIKVVSDGVTFMRVVNEAGTKPRERSEPREVEQEVRKSLEEALESAETALEGTLNHIGQLRASTERLSAGSLALEDTELRE